MIKSTHFYISLTLLFFLSCSKTNDLDLKEEKNDLKIMAYYVPSSEVNEDQLPFDKLTHIIFSFTEVIDHKMMFAQEDLGKELEALQTSAKKHPDVKVMIACGGWGGSGGFSDMAATKKNREIFINSVVAFLEKYDLDGLDLDWEYPGLPGIGNTFRPEDKENFTALVKELRLAMDSYKPGLIISFAAAGWDKYFDHIELSKVMAYVDYINLMTYDLAGGSSLTTHHTSLYGIPYEELSTETKTHLNELNMNYQPRSVNDIVQFCLNKGIDTSKIVIGAAFYGRSWKGVASENNGLHQTHNNVTSAYSYANIDQMIKNDQNNKRYWDEKSKAPYIYNAADGLFITYDDKESVALKTKYALDNKLGGIMFWQLSQDSKNNDLVNSMSEVKRNN